MSISFIGERALLSVKLLINLPEQNSAIIVVGNGLIKMARVPQAVKRVEIVKSSTISHECAVRKQNMVKQPLPVLLYAP